MNRALASSNVDTPLASPPPAALLLLLLDVSKVQLFEQLINLGGLEIDTHLEVRVQGLEVDLGCRTAEQAETLAKALLGNSEVLPIGLGARDSLRLEAGLCLYGHDIDVTTTPVEGALEWSIQKSRRNGGARAGGFAGADKILGQLENGAPRRRVGLRPEGRAPVREGAPLFASETSSEPIGAVTSGGFGPTLNAPVAMGYLPSPLAVSGTPAFAEVRGQRLPLRVSPMPFVPNTYKR